MVKNLPANTEDMGSIPSPQKIPCAVGQLSPRVTTPEAHTPTACALQQEKPAQCEALARQ